MPKTLAQVEDEMPDGLHDADLLSFEFDLQNNRLILMVDADCTSPDYELPTGEPNSRPARITISDLCYFRVEPPDLVNAYSPSADSEAISSGLIERGSGEIAAAVWERIPDDAFAYWMYLSGWNSLIVFAGKSADLEWLNGAPYVPNGELKRGL